MKQAMHRIAIGRALPQREAARLADRFARRLIADGLYTESVALIERERAAGRRIVLASAAPRLYTAALARRLGIADVASSEEHPSELQSLLRISYAVFLLKKKNKQ